MSGNSKDNICALIPFERVIDSAIKDYKKKESANSSFVKNVSYPYIYTDSEVNVLQYQPYGALDVNYSDLRLHFSVNGTIPFSENSCTSETFAKFLTDTLPQNRSKSARNLSLVLTPEYSMPLDIVKNFIFSNLPDIPLRTLYALGLEGVSSDVFDDFITDIHGYSKGANYIYVSKSAVLHEKGLVDAMLYITRLEYKRFNGESLFITILAPQLKTHPMHGSDFEKSMIRGKAVYIFHGTERKFLSLVCADMLNLALLQQIKTTCFGHEALIVNLQLNRFPRHGTFRFAETYFIEEVTSAENVKIITLNWSRGTTITPIGKGERFQLSAAWSAIREKIGGRHIDVMPIVQNARKIAKHSVEMAFSDAMVLWLFPSRSHIIEYTLLKKWDVNISKCNFFNNGILVQQTCTDAIPRFIRETPELRRLLNCEDCVDNPDIICKRDNIDMLLQGMLFHESTAPYNPTHSFAQLTLRELYELRNSEIARVMAKNHGSAWSKDALYRLHSIHHRLKRAEVVMRCGVDSNSASIEYLLPPWYTNQPFCNVRFKREKGYYGDASNDRVCVVHLKNSNKNTAHRLYTHCFNRLASNVNGINVLPDVVVYYNDNYNEWSDDDAFSKYHTGLRRFPELADSIRHGVNSLGISATNASRAEGGTSMTEMTGFISKIGDENRGVADK